MIHLYSDGNSDGIPSTSPHSRRFTAHLVLLLHLRVFGHSILAQNWATPSTNQPVLSKEWEDFRKPLSTLLPYSEKRIRKVYHSGCASLDTT